MADKIKWNILNSQSVTRDFYFHPTIRRCQPRSWHSIAANFPQNLNTVLHSSPPQNWFSSSPVLSTNVHFCLR